MDFNINNIYERLDFYRMKFGEYSEKLYTVGLNLNDYRELLNFKINLSKLKGRAFAEVVKIREERKIYEERGILDDYFSIKNTKVAFVDMIDEVLGDYYRICTLLEHNIVPRTLKMVLNEECSLVPLVVANNVSGREIKPYGYGHFIFLCQFHEENNPSMSVNNTEGVVHCLSCGISYRLITYFMTVEHLTYQEAVNLLAKIYLIDLKNEVYFEDNPIVLKYRKVLLENELKELFEEARSEILCKKKGWLAEEAANKLEKDIKTMERIQRGEHIFYSGKKPSCKKLILEK